MTKTLSTFAALLLAAAAFSPAHAASTTMCAPACPCPPAAKKVVRHAARPAMRGDRAYAAAFYDYRSASAVGRSFRAPWVEAPHDGRVPPMVSQGGYDDEDYGDDYADGYGYDTGYYGEEVSGPDLNRGWTGGVANWGGGYTGGGGGGGGGTAILAGGQNENGPTYNSFGQSFPSGGADTYAARANAYWRNTQIPIKQGN